jgi:hypothetical protein
MHTHTLHKCEVIKENGHCGWRDIKRICSDKCQKTSLKADLLMIYFFRQKNDKPTQGHMYTSTLTYANRCTRRKHTQIWNYTNICKYYHTALRVLEGETSKICAHIGIGRDWQAELRPGACNGTNWLRPGRALLLWEITHKTSMCT